jgi:hypothetical protein
MNKLMQKLMLSCRKATELIDKKIHSGISRDEKVKLYFHTMMCSACTNYEKQSYLIDKVLKDASKHSNESHSDHSVPPVGITDRIIQKLDEN